MTRLKRILVAAATAALVGVMVLGGLAWQAWNTGPDRVDGAPDTVIVRVRSGATLRSVAADLQRRGMLTRPRLFLLGARLSGRDHRLQIGRYGVPSGASPREILNALLDGRPLPIVITLTEGREADELAGVLADSLVLDAAEILASADALIRGGADTLMSGAERRRLSAAIDAGPRPDGRSLHWCEGYLAPDTYHFAEGIDAYAVAGAVVGLQLARLDSAFAGTGRAAADLSRHGLLTLAAVVEAEARLGHERRRIAAVYHNRLQRGMRLEADPTVAFWLGKRGERLWNRDLDKDSPYNTYRRRGLPAGPIGSPGAAAIRATARPDSTCEALFFVADGAGGHVFSRTLAEHLRAVARFRALMRDRRR